VQEVSVLNTTVYRLHPTVLPSNEACSSLHTMVMQPALGLLSDYVTGFMNMIIIDATDGTVTYSKQAVAALRFLLSLGSCTSKQQPLRARERLGLESFCHRTSIISTSPQVKAGWVRTRRSTPSVSLLPAGNGSTQFRLTAV
jgi:hypothetical protein